jgi:hypothetical protein
VHQHQRRSEFVGFGSGDFSEERTDARCHVPRTIA